MSIVHCTCSCSGPTTTTETENTRSTKLANETETETKTAGNKFISLVEIKLYVYCFIFVRQQQQQQVHHVELYEIVCIAASGICVARKTIANFKQIGYKYIYPFVLNKRTHTFKCDADDGNNSSNSSNHSTQLASLCYGRKPESRKRVWQKNRERNAQIIVNTFNICSMLLPYRIVVCWANTKLRLFYKSRG